MHQSGTPLKVNGKYNTISGVWWQREALPFINVEMLLQFVYTICFKCMLYEHKECTTSKEQEMIFKWVSVSDNEHYVSEFICSVF